MEARAVKVEELLAEVDGLAKTATKLVAEGEELLTLVIDKTSWDDRSEAVTGFLDDSKKTLKRLRDISDLVGFDDTRLSSEEKSRLYPKLLEAQLNGRPFSQLAATEQKVQDLVNRFKKLEAAQESAKILQEFITLEENDIKPANITQALEACASLAEFGEYANLVLQVSIKSQTLMFKALGSFVLERSGLVQQVKTLQEALEELTKQGRIEGGGTLIKLKKRVDARPTAPATEEWKPEMTDEELDVVFSKGSGGRLNTGVTRRMRNTWRLMGRAATFSRLSQGFMGDFKTQQSLRGFYGELGLKVLTTERKVRNAVERVHQIEIEDLREGEKKDLAFLAVFLETYLNGLDGSKKYRINPDLSSIAKDPSAQRAKEKASQALSSKKRTVGFGDLQKQDFLRVVEYFTKDSGSVLRSVLLQASDNSGKKNNLRRDGVVLGDESTQVRASKLTEILGTMSEDMASSSFDATEATEWINAVDDLTTLDGWLSGDHEIDDDSLQSAAASYLSFRTMVFGRRDYKTPLPGTLKDDTKYSFASISDLVKRISDKITATS